MTRADRILNRRQERLSIIAKDSDFYFRVKNKIISTIIKGNAGRMARHCLVYYLHDLDLERYYGTGWRDGYAEGKKTERELRTYLQERKNIDESFKKDKERRQMIFMRKNGHKFIEAQCVNCGKHYNLSPDFDGETKCICGFNFVVEGVILVEDFDRIMLMREVSP